MEITTPVFHCSFTALGSFAKDGGREPAAQQDVAPTLAALLQIAPPATTTGRALSQALQTANARPRVVTLFVLDGMRADYFDTYADVMPTLTRWRTEGAVFSNARLTSLPSATSIGHATLGTGTDPRIHGLVVNRLFNRVSGRHKSPTTTSIPAS